MMHLINEINNIIFEDLTINHNVKTNAKEISTLIKNEFLKKYTNGDFNNEGYKIILFNSSYNLNYIHNDDNCNENNTEDINDLIKRSETWNIMIDCQKYLNNLINNQNISELNSLLQNYNITYNKFIRIYSKRLNILKNKVGKCIIKIKMDLFKLKECSIAMTFGVLNKTLKRNVPLLYSFYKIT